MNGPERIYTAETLRGMIAAEGDPPAWLDPPRYVRADLFAAEKARADKAEALLREAVDILDLGVELVNQDDLTDAAGWDAFDAQGRAFIAKIKEAKNG